MISKAILGAAVAAAATSSFAVPQLHFVGTGLGGNVLTSRDGGASFNAFFCGELNVARCDIPSAPFYGFCTSASVWMMMTGCWNADILDTNSLSPSGSQVGRLSTQHAATVHSSASNVDAQMLQAVIWEVTSETSSTFDLTSGSFIAKNYDGSALNATQLAAAQTFLSDTTAGVATWYRAQLNDAGAKVSQDIVTPVPEPGTIVALATGLIGLFLRPRRRA